MFKVADKDTAGGQVSSCLAVRIGDSSQPIAPTVAGATEWDN